MATAPLKRGIQAKTMDEETKALLYEGASLGQLSTIFDLDNREIARKLHGLQPVGERVGYPIYSLKEAAAYLVTPKGDIEDRLKKMDPKDLPPQLQKAFWGALTERLKYEESQGDLWRTADVIETLGEAFKTLRMSVLLMQDQVERQSELTERQRDIIRGLTDGLLNNLADALVERFKHEAQRRPQPDQPRDNDDEDHGL
jgi:hypothetical protein